MNGEAYLDLIVEGKGRRVWETSPTASLTCLRTSNTLGENIFYGQVENRTTVKKTGKLKLQNIISLPWTTGFFVGGVEKTLPYEFDVEAESIMDFQIKLTTSGIFPKMGSVEIFLLEAGDVIDSGKIGMINNFVQVEDVDAEIEMVSSSEQLFPSDANYDKFGSIQPMIDEETERFATLIMDRADGYSILEEKLARDYIVKRVIVRLLKKAAVYSIGGEAVFLRTMDSYREDIRELEETLFSGYL